MTNVSEPAQSGNNPACHSRERLQHLIEHLHSLGPVPLGYFLAELRVDRDHLLSQLEKYERLPAVVCQQAGIDIFEATSTATELLLRVVKPEGEA